MRVFGLSVSSECPWLLHKGAGAVEVIRAESMSSVFLASPFLLLAVLCLPIVRGTAENVSRELRLFVLAAAGGSLLMCCVLLAFGSSSRRYMHDFVPLWMVLAWIGIAYYLRERPIPRVWVAPAWGTVVFSFLLHAHLAFTQPFDWDPPDANVMRTFVAWSPAVRRILPGKRLDREEAIARNDLGTLHLKNGRYQQALREFVGSDEFKQAQEEAGQKLKEITESQEFKDAQENIGKGLEDIKKDLFGSGN